MTHHGEEPVYGSPHKVSYDAALESAVVDNHRLRGALQDGFELFDHMQKSVRDLGGDSYHLNIRAIEHYKEKFELALNI